MNCLSGSLLLLVNYFILPNPSSIIWLLRSCKFSLSLVTYIFSTSTSSPLSMLHYVVILLLLHDIRRCPFSLVGWPLGDGLPDPELASRFVLLERGYLLSPTPGIMCLLPFIFLPSTCFKMSQLMDVMLIEIIVTRVCAYYSDPPFAEHVAIYWTPASVICVCLLNGNINS